MSKKNSKKINYLQLLLGILLNILVIIIAFIIYHEIFQKEKNNTDSLPLTTPEEETLIPEGETIPE